ncbi:MAG: RsmE family RNA methyltransferase [Ignavibacterium sp.]
MEFLSDIELFFTDKVSDNKIILRDDDFIHCIKVFRYKAGDKVFVTDGNGKIYHCEISRIYKNELQAEILSHIKQKIKYPNFHFCIPILKNKDRFRFAFEKLIELGITNIIIYKAERAISEKFNFDKYKKVAIETIKQSLQSNLPVIKSIGSLTELNSFEGNKIIFEQNAEIKFDSNMVNKSDICYFIFGPEGGLTDKEINSINDHKKFSLAENRLRTETAIIKVASVLTL